ncbi:MAG: hypothetical protein BWY65_01212 [Firmicutes bacterium ADurb.Bin373]|nr:MAG: hypothetical protein BWY65_01212 [Firmicutes bacterium ADurb.Bin373]
MGFRHYRQSVCPYFISHITVRRYTVSPDDDQVNHSFGHQKTGHIIGDQRYRYVFLQQLQSCQPGALQQGPCFIGVNAYIFTRVTGCPDDSQRGAIAGGGQSARVAMSKHAAVLRDKPMSVFANLAIARGVFVKDAMGFFQEQFS